MIKALQLIENGYARKLVKAGLPRSTIKHQVEEVFAELGWKLTEISAMTQYFPESGVGWFVVFVVPPEVKGGAVGAITYKTGHYIHELFCKDLRRLLNAALRKKFGMSRIDHVSTPDILLFEPGQLTMSCAITINERPS